MDTFYVGLTTCRVITLERAICTSVHNLECSMVKFYRLDGPPLRTARICSETDTTELYDGSLMFAGGYLRIVIILLHKPDV
jgi:hypothetical protein